jgi:hypothetical protein
MRRRERKRVGAFSAELEAARKPHSRGLCSVAALAVLADDAALAAAVDGASAWSSDNLLVLLREVSERRVPS